MKGQIEYIQIPARDIATSATFYRTLFGWSAEADSASFEAPGFIGQWTTDRPPAEQGGPLLWIGAKGMWTTLQGVTEHGGKVHGRPALDGGERWLVEIDDPAGNRVGLSFPVTPLQTQTLIAVRDVEASSRWYQRLLGFTSDHGGPQYERLLSSDGTLALQLHNWQVEHQHGRIGDPTKDAGNGVLLWFGEVTDFDAVVTRAEELGAPIVVPPYTNGPGPAHREIWIKDPDGYTVVVASPDGELFGAG